MLAGTRLTPTNALSCSQPRLCLFSLLLLQIFDLIPCAIKSSIGLIERVFWTSLEFLPNSIDPLLFPKSFVLFFQFWHSPRFIGSIRSLEPSFGMPVHLVRGIVGRKGKKVEGIVYAGGIESWIAFRCRRGILKLGKIEAFRFLDGGLCIFWGGAGVFLFFC